MLAKLIAVEKLSIKKGENIGKPYFVLLYLGGTLLKPVLYKDTLIPLFNNQMLAQLQLAECERLLAEYNAAKLAGKQYEGAIINIKQFIVGDTSINPNERPLPPFRYIDTTTGQVRPEVHTTMKVTVAVTEDGSYEIGPRQKAERIISQICELVPTEPFDADAH